MSARPIRVVIVDDQKLFRHGLRIMLELEGDIEVVGEAANGVEGLDVIAEHDPALVLIDARMPQMDGIELLSIVKRQRPQVGAIVLTTFDNDEYLLGAMRAGADGYLMKDAHPQEVLDAVRRVVDGQRVYGSAPTDKLIDFVLSSDGAMQNARREETEAWKLLSGRELEVVQLISLGHSNREISQILFTTVGTVKNHVSSVLRKLRLRDRTQLAIRASRYPPEDTSAQQN